LMLPGIWAGLIFNGPGHQVMPAVNLCNDPLPFNHQALV
jgi:hypothetical protein